MTEQESKLGLLDPADPEYAVEIAEIDAVEIDIKRETIVVIVYAPKEVDPKRFRFRLDELVGTAAKEAAEAFGYEVGNPSFQKKDGAVLDRTITLEAAKVHDHEYLELVDAGGGV